MRYLTAIPLVLGLTVLGLGQAQAAPILQDNESGSGVLRVANQGDQSLSQASIRFSSTGRFHLTTQGGSQQDFRGTWHGTAPGVYDLQVNSGFGTWGASGSGRAIFNGGQLQQFEVAGVSTGEPFYLSFGSGGYSAPNPASDGFALNLSFGGGSGFYYGQPSYANYGHYSDGRAAGNWNGGQNGAYSNYAGNRGYAQPGVKVNIGSAPQYNRGAYNQGGYNQGQTGRVQYQAQASGQGQQFNRAQQTGRAQSPGQDRQEQWADQPQQRTGQTDQRSVQPQRNIQPQQRAAEPQRAAPAARASQPQRQASQAPQQHRAIAGYGSGGH